MSLVLLTDIREDFERLDYLRERLEKSAESLQHNCPLYCATELGKLISEVQAWRDAIDMGDD